MGLRYSLHKLLFLCMSWHRKFTRRKKDEVAYKHKNNYNVDKIETVAFIITEHNKASSHS